MPAEREAIVRIANDLSDDARHFLPQLNRNGFSIHPGNQSPAIRQFLREAEKAGLITNPSFDNYFLQPLGQAVRDHLKESAHE